MKTIQWFDTHSHLQHPDFDSDRKELLADMAGRSLAALTVGTDPSSSRACVGLAEQFDHVYAAVGIHPNDTARTTDEEMTLIGELAAHPKVRAIGETGLDYYRDRTSPAQQHRILDQHIALARETGLPLVLHARSSELDLLEAIHPFLQDGGKAVWHCFVAGKKLLPRCLDFAIENNLMLGLGGLVTFEDQKPLRTLVPQIPDRLLVLETDCPYLTPRPRIEEQKRNDPHGILRVAEELAALRGVTVDDIARITTRNALTLLGLNTEGQAGDDPTRIAYPIRNSLYLNLTSRCNNSCTFCARNTSWVVKGHDIRLEQEPTTADVLAAIGDVSKYDEIVFCGFGEPTLRLDVLKDVARHLKQIDQTVRLNTNGLANLEQGRDIVPELVGLIDAVSVSLNTADPGQYRSLCQPRFGEQAYPALCEFVRACVAAGITTTCTAIAMPGIDIDAARKKAEDLGAQFRARSFVDAG